MNDRLDDVLRRAPKTGASADFTSRVMGRIGEKTRPARFAAWRPALTAAALVIVSILSGIAYENHRQEQRLEALRVEARQIEAEIEAIRKQSEKSSEVYLGGNANREYVLDLRDLTAPSSQTQTVSHSY